MSEQLSIPEINVNPDAITIDNWADPVFKKNNIWVDVLRLDKMHHEISGNKWFKLKYHLQEAKNYDKSKLISFGGPYSNHLLAVAAAAKLSGLRSVGYIRGEKPVHLSDTLTDARAYDMELRFLSRSQYAGKKNAFPDNEDPDERDGFVIPEGGADPQGVSGAAEILQLLPSAGKYTHVCVAVGTGTTLAGIANGATPDQQVIGVSVLKGSTGIQPLNMSWLHDPARRHQLTVVHGDHWGGYARQNQLLFDFMNQVYNDSGIPTDFIYTGKLFFSIVRMAGIQAFLPGSKVLVIHTGGLQGNRSLMPGLLQY